MTRVRDCIRYRIQLHLAPSLIHIRHLSDSYSSKLSFFLYISSIYLSLYSSLILPTFSLSLFFCFSPLFLSHSLSLLASLLPASPSLSPLPIHALSCSWCLQRKSYENFTSALFPRNQKDGKMREILQKEKCIRKQAEADLEGRR